MNIILFDRDSYNRLRHLIPDEFYRGLDNDEYYCLGLIDDDNNLLGVAVFMSFYDGVEIIWLCASKTGKGHGFTVNLLKTMKEKLAGYNQDLKIYASFSESKLKNKSANESIIAVYNAFEALGASAADADGGLYAVDCKDIFALNIRGSNRGDKNCIVLKDAMSWQINDMQNRMREDERDVPIASKFNINEYDTELSVLFCEGKKVTGAFLISTNDEEEIDVDLAWSISKTALVSMMLKSIDKLEEKYPNAQKIYIPTVNEISDKLVNKLFPMAVKESKQNMVIKVND